MLYLWPEYLLSMMSGHLTAEPSREKINMCGIAGMFLKKGRVDEEHLKGIHRLLEHRGPDGVIRLL
jgi:hypothetical protein